MASKDDKKDPSKTAHNDEKINAASDPFNPANLRLSQNFANSVGVKKAFINVPVRKPNRQEFVRVHADEDYRLETAILELKEEHENYLVDPALWAELPGELTPKVLFTTMNAQGVLTLWPVRMPGEDGRPNNWNSSALEAAKMAESKWIRLASNMSLGAYDVYEATGNIPDPEWPDLSYSEILKVAFKDRYITDPDHPALRRLRGE